MSLLQQIQLDVKLKRKGSRNSDIFLVIKDTREILNYLYWSAIYVCLVHFYDIINVIYILCMYSESNINALSIIQHLLLSNIAISISRGDFCAYFRFYHINKNIFWVGWSFEYFIFWFYYFWTGVAGKVMFKHSLFWLIRAITRYFTLRVSLRVSLDSKQ